MLKRNTTYRAQKLNTYRSGRRPQIKMIILHDTAGNGGLGDVKYLANDPEGRGVSIDFVVARDGTIYQLNPDLTKYTSNHAGRRTVFKGLKNGDVNAHSIGIELAQKADMSLEPVWPDDQIRAVGLLCKELCMEFNLKREDITTHAKIITDGSRSDPRKFPWATFWTYFGASELPLSNAAPIEGPKTHTVRDGETMWAIANKYMTNVEKLKALNGYDTPSTLITPGQVLIVKE
jgi:N-acetyl-anhydromuramyl-L-alanine amidase AmpD